MVNVDPIVLPEMVTLARAPAIFGLSRSGLYRLAATGHVRMLKVGTRTLVDAGSVRRFLSSLPEAQIQCEPSRKRDHFTASNIATD